MHEDDDFELRVRIDEITDALLTLADEIVALHECPRRVELVRQYEDLRKTQRRLRRAHVAVVAG